MSTNSRGKQPQGYYRPAFVDTSNEVNTRMSLERELEAISQAFIKVKEDLEKLRKDVGGTP